MGEPANDGKAPWNCRWSRVGHQVIGIPQEDQPEGLWLCARLSNLYPRHVTEEECAGCQFWEPDSPPKVEPSARTPFRWPFRA
jgi:hypothetical protein